MKNNEANRNKLAQSLLEDFKEAKHKTDTHRIGTYLHSVLDHFWEAKGDEWDHAIKLFSGWLEGGE